MGAENRMNSTLADFFTNKTYKSVLANWKKGFYTSRLLRKNEEIGGIFVYSSSELYTLFKNSKFKFKNLKRVAFHVLS
jgi:hypothetical protein